MRSVQRLSHQQPGSMHCAYQEWPVRTVCRFAACVGSRTICCDLHVDTRLSLRTLAGPGLASAAYLDVEAVGVRHRIHRHRLQPQLPARADHADRDLASVGDQHLAEASYGGPGGL